MRKNIDKIHLLSLGFPILTVISIIFRALAMLFAYDASVGYFSNSSVLTYTSRSFFAVGLVFGILTILLCKKEDLKIESTPWSVYNAFSSTVVSFSLLIFSLLYVLLNLRDIKPLHILTVFFSVAAAIFFMADLMSNKKEVGAEIGLPCAIFTILALLLIIFAEYFDYYTALNSSEKQLTIFTFVIGALYILQRARYSSGIPQPKLRLITAFVTAFIGAFTSIPGFIGSFAGEISSPKYLVYYLLSFALAVYATTDLLSSLKLLRYTKTDEE